MNSNDQDDADCEGEKNLKWFRQLADLLIRFLKAIAQLVSAAAKLPWLF
jgi:hypothetical protein